jgi:hypothetical protein
MERDYIFVHKRVGISVDMGEDLED